MHQFLYTYIQGHLFGFQIGLLPQTLIKKITINTFNSRIIFNYNFICGTQIFMEQIEYLKNISKLIAFDNFT